MPIDIARSAGADHRRVDSRHGENLVDPIDRVDRFDLDRADDLLVGVRRVIRAAVKEAAIRAEAAHAHRRVAAGADRLLRLGLVVHPGDHDAVRAAIEDPLDLDRVVPVHAGHRDSVGGRDRLEHLHHREQVDRAVLAVDDQPVPTGVRHRLGGQRARGAEPGAECGVCLRPRAVSRCLVAWGRSSGRLSARGYVHVVGCRIVHTSAGPACP